MGAVIRWVTPPGPRKRIVLILICIIGAAGGARAYGSATDVVLLNRQGRREGAAVRIGVLRPTRLVDF